VPRKWHQRFVVEDTDADRSERRHYFFHPAEFSGQEVETHLIEAPIEIRDDQL
jgi:hypothetical protein